MKIYKQETVQHVNAVEKNVGLFSNQKSSENHTEEWVFKSQILIKINVSGQVIQYKVTPLFGITLSWMTIKRKIVIS
jgi:hypothetical protein